MMLEEEIQSYHIDFCIEKMSYLYKHVKFKYFSNKDLHINDLHNSNKCTIFLYWLSYKLYKDRLETLATQVCLLNKMLHGINLFYTRKTPDVFMFFHPLGSIFGDADCNDYLLVLQSCTIGGGGGCSRMLNIQNLGKAL